MCPLKHFFIVSLVKISKWLGMRLFARKDALAPRVLVVSTTGLGDTLWATPALKAIKASFPKAHLGVLTSPLGSSVLEKNPHINEMFILHKNSPFHLVYLLLKLRKSRFDTALIFHISQRITLPLCYFAKPSTIIGSQGINKKLDFLLTKVVQHEKTHEIQRRLLLAEAMGACSKPFSMEIYLEDSHHNRAELILTQYKNKGPLIALHPGAKDRFKQWPVECFVELGRLLQKKLGATLFITGNKEEIPLTQKICKELPGCVNLASLLSIKEMGAFLSKIDLFISNDTGVMHLAFAVNAPTLALFCPTDPFLCGPFGEYDKNRILKELPTCFPCIRKKCKEPFCMLQFSAEELYNRAHNILKAVEVPC